MISVETEIENGKSFGKNHLNKQEKTYADTIAGIESADWKKKTDPRIISKARKAEFYADKNNFVHFLCDHSDSMSSTIDSISSTLV